jgi:predicted small metal-binding protein
MRPAVRTARTEAAMQKVVRCTCGVEVRAEDERELIARVQAHAREAHGLSLSDEQVLAMAEFHEEPGG